MPRVVLVLLLIALRTATASSSASATVSASASAVTVSATRSGTGSATPRASSSATASRFSCPAQQYSYGLTGCGPCGPGATFVSASLGCSPNPLTGPSDTAFFLSGSAVEGVAAFTVTAPSGVSYAADRYSEASRALSLTGGSYLSAPAGSLPSLPAGNAAASVSAWVMCLASSVASGAASIVSWGGSPSVPGAVFVLGARSGAVPTFASLSCALASTVSTLAGIGTAGSADGPGNTAAFNGSADIVLDASSGVLYVIDQNNHKIRKISPAGVVSTLAGTGSAGSADGPGTSASFNRATGIALNGAGTLLYVADQYNHKIRKVTPTGVVSTLAGSGSAGSADNSVGTSATFCSPVSVAVDAAGTVYVADYCSNKIRKVTPSGAVSTLAGAGTAGRTNGAGNTALFSGPLSVALDIGGNVYVADFTTSLIRKITPAGIVSTLAGGSSFGSTDGTGTSATFKNPTGVTVDGTGTLYVADYSNHRVRKVTAGGIVSTLAGSGIQVSFDGVGTSASFSNPRGVYVDLNGETLYVCDESSNKIRMVALSLPYCLNALPLCDGAWHHAALARTSANAHSAYVDGVLVGQQAYLTYALPASTSASLRIGWNGDTSVNGGSLFAGTVADVRVYARAISAAEVTALNAFAPPSVSPTATGSSWASSSSVTTSATARATGTATESATVSAISPGETAIATATQSQTTATSCPVVASQWTASVAVPALSYPAGLGVDAAGNVYVVELTDAALTISKFSNTGQMTTFFRLPRWPGSFFSSALQRISVDGAGNVYQPIGQSDFITGDLSGSGGGPAGIRKYTSTGYTTAVSLSESPVTTCLDGQGNIYFSVGNAIKVYTVSSGSVSTVLSTATAELNFVFSISVGPGQVFFIAAIPSTSTLNVLTLGTGALLQVPLPSGLQFAGFLAADSSGRVYVSMQSAIAVYTVATGVMTTLAVCIGGVAGLAVDSNNDLFFVDS
jgi:sugar lactone lactonase YvrE